MGEEAGGGEAVVCRFFGGEGGVVGDEGVSSRVRDPQGA